MILWFFIPGFMKSDDVTECAKRINAISLYCVPELGEYSSWIMISLIGTSTTGSAQSV